MAGHSKWANIKHRKSANDAKKAKYFGKLIKEITAAAQQGGAAPAANPRLKLAIQNAKGANVPKENIERAIHKGSGEDAASYTAVMYEGHAPYGVAVIVECMTDNPNRTVASVRTTFSKYGGSLGKSGSVAFLFHRKGVFSIRAEDVADEEAMTLAFIEAGAATLEAEAGYFYITCALENFGALQKQLVALAVEPVESSLQYLPQVQVNLADDAYKSVMKLIGALEDNEDVQQVYHNLAFKEALLPLQT
ncbi:MAG: YebC/PmpR family DNA-binding transcriptional regulator [Bacteroidota bacterium]